VVNYNNEEKTVYIIGEMEYLPGKAAGYLLSSSHTINIGLCTGVNGVDIRPPPGQKRFTVEGKDIIIARNGYFINTRKDLESAIENPLTNIDRGASPRYISIRLYSSAANIS
jgi:hypothetical protein